MKSSQQKQRAFVGLFWLLFGCLLMSINVKANQDEPALQPQRFYMGVYFPSIINLVTRADFQAAINFWLEEFGPGLGLQPIEAMLYDDITSLKQAFEQHELDFVMAPPILLAKHFQRDLLADGFVGTSLDGSAYGTALLVRQGQGIAGIKQLSGKRLLLPENDDLAALYLDSLMLKHYKKHYREVFSQVQTKDKQSSVILGLFFKQADVGMSYREIYNLMVEMNPQIKNSVAVLATFPTKSPNYGYFHRDFPADLRKKIRETVAELNHQTRSQQILNDLRMSSLVPCAVADLQQFDQLLAEQQALAKGARP